MNLDSFQGLERGLEALLQQVEGKPVAMATLARLLKGEAHRALAVELSSRALDLAPEDGEVRAITSEVLSADVPHWHFEIVRDLQRNEAYETALRRAIVPGCKVLEIGTGSGLLAMMAARAGAGEVVTCEADPAVAMVARANIARNGYADRVRVIAKHSTALDVKSDLHGPADILVSEIVSNDLLSEGALPAIEHAVLHLIKPDARVIPVRGRVRVALADNDEWEGALMGQVAGFDLSAFNRLAASQRQIAVGSPRLTLCSDAADLFSFDFASGGPFPPLRSETVLVSHGRWINGIAQWIALDMDAEGVCENRPEPGARSSWWAVFHPFERAIQTTPGQTVTVRASHDRGTLRIWAV
ncbi:MAG TPA: 50S ribosomal protein L11 methyltransferase [Steroidobacteraceae bacterium]|jgi:hypothetical protein